MGKSILLNLFLKSLLLIIGILLETVEFLELAEKVKVVKNFEKNELRSAKLAKFVL